jgi:hypothetical protein
MRVLATTLLLVAPLALGAKCGGSGDGGSRDAKNSGPTAALRVEPAQVVYFAGGYYLKVDVYVSANDPMQAWDVTLTWNTVNLEHLGAAPAVEFDDDGVFFQSSLDPEAGTLTLVDLRHTGEVSGDLRVAEIWLVARNGGVANVTIQGAVADGAGTPFDIVANTNGTFPITP